MNYEMGGTILSKADPVKEKDLVVTMPNKFVMSF